MLKERVAEWLDSIPTITDVKPVLVTHHKKTWEGAVYTQGGEQKFYLVGDLPKRHGKVCYILHEIEKDPSKTVKRLSYEWFISGYINNYDELSSENKKFFPFGNHWLMSAWVIKDDPESKIDDYESELYHRECVYLEIQ